MHANNSYIWCVCQEAGWSPVLARKDPGSAVRVKKNPMTLQSHPPGNVKDMMKTAPVVDMTKKTAPAVDMTKKPATAS